MPLEYYSLGDIRNTEDKNCLDTFGRKSGENVAVTQCHNLGGNQVFAYTKRKQIMSDDNCLDASDAKTPVKLIRCHGMGGNQQWEYKEETMQLIHTNTKLCLDQPDSNVDNTLPVLRPCDKHSKTQKWKLNSNFKWQSSKHEDSDKNEINDES